MTVGSVRLLRVYDEVALGLIISFKYLETFKNPANWLIVFNFNSEVIGLKLRGIERKYFRSKKRHACQFQIWLKFDFRRR